MLFVFLLYMLLSLRITVRLSAGAAGCQNAVSAAVGAMGLWLRYDGFIRLEEKKLRICPRYGKRKKRGRKLKQRAAQYKKLKPWMCAVLPAFRFVRLELRLSIGLGDAQKTAVAAGTIRAALSALPAVMGIAQPLDLLIQPVFDRTAFQTSAYCIFSFTAGDIMFAAIRHAFRKMRKEGFGWISIPLRA